MSTGGRPNTLGGRRLGPKRAPNRRLHDRIDVGAKVEVCEVGTHGSMSAPWGCELADISRSGVGLRSRRMVHSGRKLFILIPLADGTRRILFGVARHAAYDRDGMYAVGVQFEEVPNSPEIRRWIAAHTA